MLTDQVREAARQSITPRFEILDEVLCERLARLASQAQSVTLADELASIGVNVRLACEHDLNERAFAAWRALKRNHQVLDGHSSTALRRSLRIELHIYMSDASINLANRLAEHAEALAPTFAGEQPLDVAWIKRQQRLAEEKQLKDIESYLQNLHRSLKSWVVRGGGD